MTPIPSQPFLLCPGQSQCLALFAAPPPEASAKGGALLNWEALCYTVPIPILILILILVLILVLITILVLVTILIVHIHVHLLDPPLVPTLVQASMRLAMFHMKTSIGHVTVIPIPVRLGLVLIGTMHILVCAIGHVQCGGMSNQCFQEGEGPFYVKTHLTNDTCTAPICHQPPTPPEMTIERNCVTTHPPKRVHSLHENSPNEDTTSPPVYRLIHVTGSGTMIASGPGGPISGSHRIIAHPSVVSGPIGEMTGAAHEPVKLRQWFALMLVPFQMASRSLRCLQGWGRACGAEVGVNTIDEPSAPSDWFTSRKDLEYVDQAYAHTCTKKELEDLLNLAPRYLKERADRWVWFYIMLATNEDP
ncbi:hypothetical protein BS47DRAFT_1360545 [Hydnum rufescens UP504]|uniref:Uncharacterized protein n=1 Tax=Hydnum rufescens UP504 TaxID=1448309 RepID=A0A9P6B4H0_9AGAM|nr:hypothetical protein BS47DRAFT_1360545 [Hydnum rufescens UP504]